MKQYPKKEKKPNTAVMYEIEEFIYGRVDYVTDCPFGECGRVYKPDKQGRGIGVQYLQVSD